MTSSRHDKNGKKKLRENFSLGNYEPNDTLKNFHLSPSMTILDSLTLFLRREEPEIPHEDEEFDVEEQLQETKYSLTEMGQQQKDVFDYNELGQTIKIASEGALALKTVATYRRHVSLFHFISKITDDEIVFGEHLKSLLMTSEIPKSKMPLLSQMK